MSELSWSSRARADLQQHYNYLFVFSQRSATDAFDAIVTAAEQLLDNPYQGMILSPSDNLRKWPVAFGKYGFVLHYQVSEKGDVKIARVYHGAQNRPY